MASSLTLPSPKVPSVVVLPGAAAKLTLWLSIRSTSVKLIVPVALGVPSSTTAPVAVAPVMVTTSLVPVTVTATTWLTALPVLSVMVTVKFSVRVSPTASAWTKGLLLLRV